MLGCMPSTLVLGITPNINWACQAYYQGGSMPSKARHVMPSMLGVRQNGGLGFPCPSSGVRLVWAQASMLEPMHLGSIWVRAWHPKPMGMFLDFFKVLWEF